MRNTLFILLLPTVLCAQREVVSDSTWITSKFDSSRMLPVYYQHKLYEYDNGESGTNVRLISDSTQAIGFVVSQELDAIRHLSQQAVAVIGKNAVIKEWQEMHANTIAVGLGNMASVIQQLYENNFLGNCAIRENGVIDAGSITKNAQNVIRLTYKGKTYRVFIFADTMIRVLNYPGAGEFLDLYQINERSYSDISRTFILRVRNE